MRIHVARTSIFITALMLLGSVPQALRAQTANVPGNYQGPTVVGFCFYTQPSATQTGATRAAATQPSAVSYAGPITISNYFRFDAERAFHQYAATHAPTAQNVTCRWSTQQQYAAAADKSFHATDRAGHPIQATQTGWHYTPGAGGMTNAQATTNTAAPATSAAAHSNGAYGTAPATTSSAAATSPGASIAQSANASKQAITASGASSVTDTMGSATTSLTNAMQGGVGKLFHKKQAAAATDATTPAATNDAGANSASNPASNVVPSPTDANPNVATIPGAADAAASGAGPSFVFCHLQAAGSTYVSDIFPSTDATDAGAQTAFWKQVGHQYKLASVPFRDNVACVRSSAEQQAITTRQTLISGSPAGKIIDTAWTYMGDPTK